MDINPLLQDFIDELLGASSSHGLTPLPDHTSPAVAAAVIRLRLRLHQGLQAEGWTPPPGLLDAMAVDEQLLREADDTGLMSPAEPLAPAPRDGELDPAVELMQMRRAMESRAIIEQAKGIAMERFGLSAEVAWAWLVRTSQQRNVKLREIAHELVAGVSSAVEGSAAGSNGEVVSASR